MSEPLLLQSFIDQIAEHERRLAALERAPQLGSSSIKEGTLSIVDSAGVTRVSIGKDGTDYGVKVYDAAGANAVSLSNLLFGLQVAQNDAVDLTARTTWGDIASAGPAVTVNIGPSGRALLILSSFINCLVNNANGEMGCEVSGATSVSPGSSTAVRLAAATAETKGRFSAASLLTGLNPGSTTFTTKYITGGSNVSFGFRTILVLPL